MKRKTMKIPRIVAERLAELLHIGIFSPKHIPEQEISPHADKRPDEKVQQIARVAGLQSTSLVWNTAYKGIDDWQLALRQEEAKEKAA